jgi:hypothetical protein
VSDWLRLFCNTNASNMRQTANNCGHRLTVAVMSALERQARRAACAALPHTIIAPDGSPAGHVDVGSLGVADRPADLAVASMNLDYNYGPGWETEFFMAYGIEPDEERMAFYRFLWENEETIGVHPRGSR